MRDWNVVVTAHKNGYTLTCELLEELDLGPITPTGFYNVLVMKVADTQVLLDKMVEIVSRNPGLLSHAVSRVAPAQHTFNFQSPEEFEAKAREIALGWVSDLAGKAFHVRLHRRGFKGRISSPVEEHFLDNVLLNALQAAGKSGSLSFDDPDAVIQVETVGNRAGMSLWSRDELASYPFLRVD